MEHTKEYRLALEALEVAALAERDRCLMLRLVRALDLLKQPCIERIECAIAGIPIDEF